MNAATILEEALRRVPFVASLDLRIEDAAPGRVVVRVPRRLELTNVDGALHGAAVSAACEIAAAVAVGTEPTLARLPTTLRSTRGAYLYAARTDVTCHATVSAEQASAVVRALGVEERAVLEVPVRALDGHGTEVVGFTAVFVVRARRG